jgi:hypothetical protein
MNDRRSRWIAWSAAVLAFALFPATYFILSWPHAEPLEVETGGNSIVAAFSALSMSVVGAAVVSRHPRHLVGWIYVVAGLLLVSAFFTTAYTQYASQYPDRLPAGGLANVISGLSFIGGFFLPITFGLLLFPDGRLVSQGWRPVAWFAGGALVLPLVQSILREASIGEEFIPWTNGAIVASVAASAASVVIRWRRSRGVEREQLKWIGFAAVVFVAIIVADEVLEILIPGFHDASGFTLITAGLALLPISIGIAILRYRLFEIDRIVSRTISYVIVTGVLGAVFAIVVVGLQAMLTSVTKGQGIPVAASTLVVFALFQPLRRRVQSAIDRRFDRARYDGERTVAEFAGRLRDEVDLARLRGELRAVIGRSLAPTSVGVWLRSQERTAGR